MSDESLAGISGDARYHVVSAQYLSAREDGTLRTVDGEIRIAQPIADNSHIPSVLGWDVLRHFRLLLDHRTGEVLLEDAPPPGRLS